MEHLRDEVCRKAVVWPAEGVTLSGAWFRWKLRMDRISGDIREDRRPKVQDTWVTVCESLRRKDRECLQAFCMLFCYESPIHSTGALFVAYFLKIRWNAVLALLFTQHLNTCCSDAYESDSGVSSPPFAKQICMRTVNCNVLSHEQLLHRQILVTDWEKYAWVWEIRDYI